MRYGKFASIYDQLMEDIPYDKYAEWVCSHIKEGRVLDLACGTGVLSQLLAELGFEVTAADLSDEMLVMANSRFEEAGQRIPVLQLSMDDLEGLSGFDAVTIAIDSLNYLEEEEQVQETFRQAYAALNPGGWLLFDVHSIYKTDVVYMDSPFVYDGEDIAYIWHTEQGEYAHSVFHDLTFFMRSGNLFERFEESHEQRTFAPDQYKEWLKQAGFELEAVTADFTDAAPVDESERIFFSARKR